MKLVRRALPFVLCVLVLASLAAQEAPSNFQPLDTLPQDELNPGPLVYGAYAFVWAVVLLYVFTLWRKIGRIERELADLKSKK